MRAVKPKDEIDSVRAAELALGRRGRALDVLMEAQQHWLAMGRFREKRRRCIRYCYGDQWSDQVNVDGCLMREDDYIRQQGSVPLQNNHIHRMVRTVLGVYRNQSKEPTCIARDRDEQQMAETMSTVLQCNWQANQMGELNARLLEEFLLSSMVVCRKSYGWREQRMDCWTECVNPAYFFLDMGMRDLRGWDCGIVGEIHDVGWGELLAQFAKKPEDHRRLSDIYGSCRNRRSWASMWENFGEGYDGDEDFLVPRNHSKCRVIEVWRKETRPCWRCHDYNSGEMYKIGECDYPTMVEAENRRRLQQGREAGMAQEDIPLIRAEWFVDEYWRYYYLSPVGDILAEGETPYWHKSHPYVWKVYPFIDGELHSFVGDVIDQQRHINRLVTLYDWIIKSSAKGSLMVPEESLPDGWTLQDLAEEWARPNGVFPVKTRNNPSGAFPKQMAQNMANIGIDTMLNIQLKFFEEISGVNGALQGKQGFSGMSASLYSQQTQNAATGLLDILEAFSDFKHECASKDVKIIQQYYDGRRVKEIVGQDGVFDSNSPENIHTMEFNLSVTESTATPAYRYIVNQFLLEIWRAGQISLKQLLRTGSFEFGDKLLQDIELQEQQQAQAQAAMAQDSVDNIPALRSGTEQVPT